MKYFSFSLFDYGDYEHIKPSYIQKFQFYVDGFKRNSDIIHENFPDFKIVLYADVKLKGRLDFSQDIDIIWIEYPNEFFTSMASIRYHILYDRPYDVVIIRDVDQIISSVDVTTIKDWLDSDSQMLLYTFHPYNSVCEFEGICGGGFATKSHFLDKYYEKEVMLLLISNAKESYICDGKYNSNDEYYLFHCLGYENILKFDESEIGLFGYIKRYIFKNVKVTNIILTNDTTNSYYIWNTNVVMWKI